MGEWNLVIFLILLFIFISILVLPTIIKESKNKNITPSK